MNSVGDLKVAIVKKVSKKYSDICIYMANYTWLNYTETRGPQTCLKSSACLGTECQKFFWIGSVRNFL